MLSRLALFLVASTCAVAGPQPDYALSAICQADPRQRTGTPTEGGGDDAALTTALSAPRLIYSSDGPALRAVLDAKKRLKLSTPILVYMGGLTTNNDDVPLLERTARTGIAMTPVAKLESGIDAGAPTFAVQTTAGRELAIKASTAAVSDAKAASRFCFWVRIDDELMRVTAVSKDGHVTVERGYDGTRAAEHHSGATILSPVYLGNRNQLGAARHSNSWPGGPDYVRYALDPGQPAAAKFKGGVVVRVMKTGYDGAWFDTFQPVPYNLCDALGRKVTYFWDFAAGGPYDFAGYAEAMKTYLRAVRATVRAAAGREPILYANSATVSYARGLKALFNHGATRDLLDGYCFEDSYLIVQAQRDGSRSKSVQARFVPITGERWLTNINNEADAARSGLNAFCMAGPAGYLAGHITPDQPNHAQLVRYAYGSYLLTVTRERSTSFGWPLLVSTSGGATRAAPWPNALFADIGDPVEENTIAALRPQGSDCYVRHFAHGMVIVNPGSAVARLPVSAGYVDAFTGEPVTAANVPAADALVLRRAGSAKAK